MTTLTEGAKLTKDETAWLIEETWSGFVHYVHRDYRCDKLAAEWRQNRWRDSYGAPARHTEKLITKNIDEAMRFATKDAADLWLAMQPRWMSKGDQYQVREHLWPDVGPTALPQEGGE